MEQTQAPEPASRVTSNSAPSDALTEYGRYRGYAGGFLPRHRALLFSPSNPAKILGAIALTLSMSLLWYLSLDTVSAAWLSILSFCHRMLGLGGYTSMVHYVLGGVRFSIPYLHLSAPLPNAILWWSGAFLTMVLVAVSLLIPRSLAPAAYLLRLTAIFQATAQVFFAFWPSAFPYEAGGYVHGLLIAGLMLISLLPVVLGFTYYIFDFSLGRKILLTVLLMVHLAVLMPVQYFLHAYLLQHGSLLFMPLLFFMFGLPLDVMVFIAFFTWGFSWKNMLHAEKVQWRIRHRFV